MMKRPAAVMKRPACHKRPAANVASSRVSGSEVADTAPDWLVEPDPTAQLYVFLVTAAKLVIGKDETQSSGEGRPPPGCFASPGFIRVAQTFKSTPNCVVPHFAQAWQFLLYVSSRDRKMALATGFSL